VPFTLPARLTGKRVVLTVDGIEWERTSYSSLARAYLRSFAEFAMVFPNVTVADSLSSQKWYNTRTGLMPDYIPYGTTSSLLVDEEALSKHGLRKEKYIVFAGRLVSEKGAHTLIEAFRDVAGDLKLVIVGDAPTQTPYVKELKARADSRTVFTGYLYGRDFESLRNGALIYVHPSTLEGTSISLLGALGAGRCVLASDLKENQDVAGDSAFYFKNGDVHDLSQKIAHLLRNPDLVQEAGRNAYERATKLQGWDAIALQYEKTYEKVLEHRSS
jgi:glycosyltransferase involved in cell wall biosynthesis